MSVHRPPTSPPPLPPVLLANSTPANFPRAIVVEGVYRWTYQYLIANVGDVSISKDNGVSVMVRNCGDSCWAGPGFDRHALS
jgi:hypothetical protein